MAKILTGFYLRLVILIPPAREILRARPPDSGESGYRLDPVSEAWVRFRLAAKNDSGESCYHYVSCSGRRMVKRNFKNVSG